MSKYVVTTIPPQYPPIFAEVFASHWVKRHYGTYRISVNVRLIYNPVSGMTLIMEKPTNSLTS